MFMRFHEKRDHLLNSYWVCKRSRKNIKSLTSTNKTKNNTSTLHRALQCTHHEAVLTHADEAAESVLAGLSWWTRVSIALTLIHICNATQTRVKHQQHISLHNSPSFWPCCLHSRAHPHLFKTNTHTNQTSRGQVA